MGNSNTPGQGNTSSEKGLPYDDFDDKQKDKPKIMYKDQIEKLQKKYQEERDRLKLIESKAIEGAINSDIICPICPKIYRDQVLFKVHFSFHHTLSIAKVRDDIALRIDCKNCGESFNNESVYIHHIDNCELQPTTIKAEYVKFAKKERIKLNQNLSSREMKSMIRHRWKEHQIEKTKTDINKIIEEVTNINKIVEEVTKKVKSENKEEIECKICLTNKPDCVLGCGHIACSTCIERMPKPKKCHMCRQPFKSVNKLFIG